MSKKYAELQYKFLESNIDQDVSRYLEESTPKTSCWFSSLNINTSESLIGKYIPSIPKFIGYLQHKCLVLGEEKYCDMLSDNYSTAKTCPGLKTILTDSILVKAPCDILITIDDRGAWVYNVPAGGLVTLVEHHNTFQFGHPFNKKGQELFKNKRVIKFIMPLQLSTDGISYIHLDPQLHTNRTSLTTVNGVIGGVSTDVAPLNIITTYEIPSKGTSLVVDIKKGDVLAYLWSSSPLVLKKYKGNHSSKTVLHDKFLNTFGRKNNENSDN